MIVTGADGKPEILRAISTFRKNPDTGADDDIMLDINGALTIDYVRKVMRTAAGKNRQMKNTVKARANVRTTLLVEALKLDKAEILQDVKARANELTVILDPNDRYGANAAIPCDWVRGLHVLNTTLYVY